MTDDHGDDADGDGEDRQSDPPEEPLGDLADELRNGDAEREGPLSDVASEIDATDEDRPDLPGDLFEEGADVGDVDREALWRQVAGEDAVSEIAEETGRAAAYDGPTVHRPDAESGTGSVTVEERTERVVEKAKYCHGCEYFSEPPDVHCTHDGTEIMEMIDVDHFRLANCPVVAEDEELENV